MAKYYVQCGAIRQVLAAKGVEQAALALIDVALQPHLWIYDDPTLSDADRRDHVMLEAMLHLGSTIQVNERGFDRQDAFVLGTPEIILQWHALIVSVTRLLVDAGLVTRNESSVAALPSSASSSDPRLPR